MPRKVRQLKADLQKAGFVWRSGKGSHTVWEHELLPSERVTLSGHDGDDAEPYQERDVRVKLKLLREIMEKMS
jgi:predicted RNA binding protein YcfA (HicA-like mRNA interferase family)